MILAQFTSSNNSLLWYFTIFVYVVLVWSLYTFVWLCFLFHFPLICIIALFWPLMSLIGHVLCSICFQLATFSIEFSFLMHQSSSVLLTWLEVTTISTVNTFHLHQSSLYPLYTFSCPWWIFYMPLTCIKDLLLAMISIKYVINVHHSWPRYAFYLPSISIKAFS